MNEILFDILRSEAIIEEADIEGCGLTKYTIVINEDVLNSLETRSKMPHEAVKAVCGRNFEAVRDEHLRFQPEMNHDNNASKKTIAQKLKVVDMYF